MNEKPFLTFTRRYRERIAFSLMKGLPNHGRILDIGCGEYPRFLRRTEFAEKYGFDPRLKETGTGRETGTETEAKSKAEAGLRLKKAAASPKTLDYPSDYFDIITMLAVAEHIGQAELKPLFMHLRKILKPSGRLIITMPSHSADPILHFLAAINIIPKEKFADHTYHTREEFSALLKECGFEQVKFGRFEFGLNNYWSMRPSE